MLKKRLVIVCEGLHACQCVSVHLSWCVLLVTPVKGMRATGNSPSVPLLSPSPAPSLQQTGFWCYTNLPSGLSPLLRDSPCPPHLPPPDHPPLLSVFSPQYLPSPRVIILLFFLTLTLPRHVSSPASLSWPGLLPPLCVSLCVQICVHIPGSAVCIVCPHVCCKARKGSLLIC